MQTANLAIAAKRGANPPAEVVSAVQNASAKTGVNFAYLMEKAAVESGYDSTAKAPTSSATGLYQFTEQTWLRMVNDHGAENGLGKYADAIDVNGNGKAVVADPKMQREILDLRNDPRASALMAAEFARDNRDDLQASVGGKIGSTELYLAHFLGSGGAAKFLGALRQNPNTPAATVMPEAAAANKGVFYDETGRAKSLKEVYDRFAAKFDGTAAPTFTNPIGGVGTSSLQARFGHNPDALSDMILAGSGGKQLSLYTILTLAALDVPTHNADQALRKQNDPLVGGKTFLGSF